MKSHRLRRFATTSLCFTLLAALGSAQESKARKQAEFLRKIARDLGFVSLAKDEVDRLKKESKESADTKSLLLLDIEITLIGAKRVVDREERRSLYKQVLDQVDEFTNKYKDDPEVLRARITLIEAAQEYGRFLSDAIEAALIEEPERAKTLETDAANLYRRGVDACDEVMKSLKASGGEDKVDYLKSWLFKGILLREHGRAIKKERVPLCGKARSVFEEMILKVGEESVIGQRGLFEMAQIDQVLGNNEAAAQAFQDCADSADKALTGDEAHLTGAAAELIQETMEEAYEKLTSTLFELGKGEEVLKAVAQYRERLKALGDAKPDARFGDMVLLTEARVFAESGDPAKLSKGLESARHINKQHPNDIVGLRAKSLLKDILNNAGAAVHGEDLFEIAKGDHQAKRFDDGIRGYKRAIAAMNAEEKAKIGLDTWYQMGLAFAAQDRFLEAILAMKKGLDLHPPQGEEQDASSIANTIKAAMNRLSQITGKDPAFASLENDVGEIVKKYGGKGSEAKLHWDTGRQRLDEKRYAEAADAYGKIAPDSIYYELGRARLASAWQLAAQPEKARQAITEYREWQKSKDAKIDNSLPTASTKLRNRQVANAECDFVEGYLLYLEANGVKGFAAKKDPTKLPAVVAKLSDYKQRYGKDAPVLTQRALDTLARAQAQMGDLEKAETTYRTLREYDEKSTYIPALLSMIFSAHANHVAEREKEFKAVKAQAGAKPEDVKASGAKLAAAQKAALTCGLDYAQNAAQPPFGTLYTALRYAEDLKDSESAIKLCNQIIKLYGTDPKEKDKVDRYVRLSLGNVMLQQQKFRDAYDLLIEAEKVSPKNTESTYKLKRAICRALGGWFETDPKTGKIIRVPGLDKPGEAYKKYWEEYKPFGLNKQRAPDYSLAWYEFYWEAYSFALAASAKDSAFQKDARSLYNIASANNEFGTLKNELGADGKALFDLFEANPPK